MKESAVRALVLLGLCNGALFLSPVTPGHLTYAISHATIHARLGIVENAHGWPPMEWCA